MKLASQLLILILPAFINAQMVDFNLKNINGKNFQDSIEPFITAVSISSANHFEDLLYTNKRLQIGVAFNYGVNISGNDTSSKLFGGFPSIGAGLMISENLKIKGTFAIFNSGEDLIQSFAYGAGIKLSANENSSWHLSLLFSELNGPTDIELKSMDGNINYGFKIVNISTIIGIGTNSYKSKILIDDNELPNTIKDNTVYLLLGTKFAKGNFTTTPIIKFSPKALILGLEFSGVVS